MWVPILVVMIKIATSRDMATRRIFWGLCINLIGIGPLHYVHVEPFRFWLRIRGDIRKLKNDSPTRRIGESTKKPTDTIFFKPLNKSMVIVHYIPGMDEGT
jgi:hypothetical protein